MRKRVLFITYSRWTEAGDSQYSLSFLQDLASRYNVALAGPVKPKMLSCEFYELQCETGFSAKRFSFGTYSFLKPKESIGEIGFFNFVVVDHLRSYYLLDAVEIGKETPLVYLSHNWEYKNLIENVRVSRSFISIKKAILNFGINRFEKRLHRNSIVVHADILGKDMRYYPMAKEAEKQFVHDEKAPIIFTGNLTWYPNINAIKSFLLPLALKVDNDIVLIGKGGTTLDILDGLDKIRRHDFIKYIHELYPKSSGLFVVSKGGTGIKLKIINSLGHYLKIYCNEEILDSFPSEVKQRVKKESHRIGELYAFESNKELFRLYNKYQKATTDVIFEKIELLIEQA